MLQTGLEPVWVLAIKAHVHGLSQPLFNFNQLYLIFNFNHLYLSFNFNHAYLIFWNWNWNWIELRILSQLSFIPSDVTGGSWTRVRCLLLRRTSMGSHSPFLIFITYIWFLILITYICLLILITHIWFFEIEIEIELN